jgi:hypothetical protein
MRSPPTRRLRAPQARAGLSVVGRVIGTAEVSCMARNIRRSGVFAPGSTPVVGALSRDVDDGAAHRWTIQHIGRTAFRDEDRLRLRGTALTSGVLHEHATSSCILTR